MSGNKRNGISAKSFQMTASVLAAASATSLLSASISVNGLEIPMLRLAPNIASAADTASTLITEMISALPRASRLTEIQYAIDAFRDGGIARALLYTISMIHLVLFALAVTLAITSLVSCWKGRERNDAGRGTSLASIVTSLVTGGLICAMCGGITWLVVSAQHALVQGDPYAVGRGIDAIGISVTPGVATVAAVVLAVAAAITWVTAVVRSREAHQSVNDITPTDITSPESKPTE